jgi:hypothetical protein
LQMLVIDNTRPIVIELGGRRELSSFVVLEAQNPIKQLESPRISIAAKSRQKMNLVTVESRCRAAIVIVTARSHDVESLLLPPHRYPFSCILSTWLYGWGAKRSYYQLLRILNVQPVYLH